MMGRAMLAISISERKVTAVTATARRDGLRIDKVLRCDMPSDVDSDDPVAVGKWLRQTLAENGIRAKRVVMAEDRQGAVIKVLRFDSAPQRDDDLPGMVHMQMLRQLTFPAEDAVLDFVRTADRTEEGVSVLAAAIPRKRLAWRTSLCKAAGLSLSRLALRTSGVASMLRIRSQEEGHAILGLAPGRTECEMIVLDHGMVTFSRSILLPHESEATAAADRAARLTTEARRTWMSYRISTEARDVGGIVVLGDGDLSRALAERSGADLGLRAGNADRGGGGRVEWNDEPGPDAEALALAGMLLEAEEGVELLDFAHPRKSPDRAAALRQKVLIGVLLLVIVVGVFLTFRIQQVEAMRTEEETLTAHRSDLRRTQQEILRDEILLEHARGWEGAEVDWLHHLDAFAQSMPDPERAILDSISLTGVGRIDYDPPSRRSPYNPKYWSSDVDVVINVEGRAIDRATANALREALVRDARYRAAPIGNDAAARRSEKYVEAFGLSLVSNDAKAGDDKESD